MIKYAVGQEVRAFVPHLAMLNGRTGKVARITQSFSATWYTVDLPGWGANLFAEDELIAVGKVASPPHYSHPDGVQCRTIVAHYPYFIGAAIAYLRRAGKEAQDPIEDLEKAIESIRIEIDRIKEAASDRRSR